MNEKIKVLELLTAALKQVDAALDAIATFAMANNILLPGSTVPVGQLAYLVGKKIDESPFRTEEVIRATLSIVSDLGLTIRTDDNE